MAKKKSVKSKAKSVRSKAKSVKHKVAAKKRLRPKIARPKRAVSKKRTIIEEGYTTPVQKFEVPARSVHYETARPAPEMAQPAPQAPSYEFPADYGEDRIVIQVRDPYWIYAYWELTQDTKHRVEVELKRSWDSLAKRLRIYDVTDIVFNGANAHRHFDIEIDNYAHNWYINAAAPGRAHCVDIGVLTEDGRFITLARSNVVKSPRDSVSPVIDEEWMIPDDMFARLYALSGGLRVGATSGELKEMMKKRLAMELASGAVSSISSPMARPKEKRFWLLINTELILYGATEPDAKLTVQGRPVALRPDGTFSLRFALPDGKQILPVGATSKDGRDCETITTVVSRETNR